MKKISILLLASAALALCGCGAKVDENKTPEQAKAEASTMDAASLQKQVDALKAFMLEKQDEAKKVADKIAQIPLKEQLGDNAKALRAEASKIGDSLKNVGSQLSVYAEELKNKAAAAVNSAK